MEPQDDKRRPNGQDKMGEKEKKALRDICLRDDVRKDGKIDIPLVQKLTGYSYQKIISFIRHDPYLHAQVPEANANKLLPTEADQIDGEMPPALPESFATLTRDQYDEYKALVRQNKKMLAADWQKFGMSEDDGARMEHYCTLGTAPMSGILRATSGQLISNLAILDRVIKADAERVLAGRIPSELDKKGEPRERGEVERDWRYMVYAGMNLQLQMFSHVHKVQAIMARVAKDLMAMNAAGRPATKGEFESRR